LGVCRSESPKPNPSHLGTGSGSGIVSPDTEEKAGTEQGYNLLYWKRAQTAFRTISDLNVTELGQFARLVRDLASLPLRDLDDDVSLGS